MGLKELLDSGMSEVDAIQQIMSAAGLTIQKKREVKRTISVNKNGGLYFKDPAFKAWSTAKNKEYIAGINMDMKVAKALFNDVELLAQLKDFVNQSEEELEEILEAKAEKRAEAEAKKSLGLYN